MFKSGISFALPLLVVSNLLFSQKTVVSGKVVDNETNEPVPFTNICFQHSPVGTISEMDGSYYLSTNNATDTLLISSLGYEIKRIPVITGREQLINVSLVPTSFALEAVIIKPGENPAFRILRDINDHKKQNDPSRLQSYQYKAYTKLRLDMNNINPRLKDKRLMKEFGFVFDYLDSSELFNKNLSLQISFYDAQLIFHVQIRVILRFAFTDCKQSPVLPENGRFRQSPG